jgi:hypothetical protein
MAGRSRAGPRRGASISRPAAVIFHARVEPAATKTAVALEQHERSRDVIRASVPRCGTCRGDLVGADCLSVVLVLGIAEGAEDDALLGGHDPTNLARCADARNRGGLFSALRSRMTLEIQAISGMDRPDLSALERLDEPAELSELRVDVDALLPDRVAFSEILLEVCRWTDFGDAFTHLSEGRARVEDLHTVADVRAAADAFSAMLARPEDALLALQQLV